MLAFLLLASLSFTSIVASDDVLVLTTDNFDQAIADNEFILVEFYAPWCGHCKQLIPEYDSAAKQLAEKKSSIKLAKVDATVETSLATKFEVKGYPTLLFFRNQEHIKYTGGRTADDIIAWCTKKTVPSLEEFSSSESLKAFLSSNEIAVVGFASSKSSEVVDLLTKLGDSMETAVFGYTTNQDVAGEHGAKGEDQIVLFKKFDEEKVKYTGAIKPEDVELFIKMESVPLVVEFSEKTASIVFGSPVQVHVLTFIGKSSAFADTKEFLVPLAQKFKGKAHFVMVDTDLEDHKRILEFFGLIESEVPAVRIIDMNSGEMLKYKPDSKEVTSDVIEKHLAGVLDGSVEPHLMSEDVKEDDPSAPVKELVGKIFNDFVSGPKAVFVMHYAPWCGHCKEIKPVWEKLGEKYKDSSDVVIAKMDATKNEAKKLSVRSFPTLTYYPKGSSEAVEYTGDRKIENFIKFIESEGKSSDAPATEDADEDEARDEL